MTDVGDNIFPPETPVSPAQAGDALPTSEPAPPPRPRWGGWTLPILCAGIAVIACCLLIPQADENRRLAYETEKLRLDLEQIKRQVSANEEFARRVVEDPSLAERLAQRQMNLIRDGTSVLRLKCLPQNKEISPFLLTAIPPPESLPPYQPAGGKLSQLCLNSRSQLYLMGAGLLLLAAGLVLGYGSPGEN